MINFNIELVITILKGQKESKWYDESLVHLYVPLLKKLANVQNIYLVDKFNPNKPIFENKGTFYQISPLEGEIMFDDVNKKREENENELRRLESFKIDVENKLNNQKFIDNAKPKIVEKERQKLIDINSKIISLKQILNNKNISN